MAESIDSFYRVDRAFTEVFDRKRPKPTPAVPAWREAADAFAALAAALPMGALPRGTPRAPHVLLDDDQGAA